MTQEEKELLSKDLCGRLPGVKVDVRIKGYKDIKSVDCVKYDTVGTYIRLMDDEKFSIKPYLRPMSSMTEEEKEELRQEHIKDEKLFAECLKKAANGDSSMRGKVVPHFAADWCNKNHFDYRGLIPMGLALEAPEEMYIN